jgi:hypothetical protein
MKSGKIKVEPCNDVGEVERGKQKCQWKGKEGGKEEDKDGERKRIVK